jgi:excisionase family DNA binding protein
VTTPEASADAELPQFMTVQEVAGALRVSRATVYRLVNSGALAANHIGKSVRVTRRAVDEYLRHHTRPATDKPG